MANFINTGDTIEAEHTDVCSRKIEWKGLRKQPDTEAVMTLYECDRNSSAEIVKIYEGEIKECTKHFYRNKGDILKADAISVYTQSARKEKSYIKEGVTGRHGAQFLDLRKRSISTIKQPLENLLKCIEEKAVLSVKKNDIKK
jgi:hypothetical protein